MDPLDPAGLARLHDVAVSHLGPEAVPGMVVGVERDGQVHVEALGTLSIDGAPVRRDSLFRIASITKPITGAATLALVDEGLFSLDDTVDGWLPELAEPRVLRRMDGPLDDTVAARRAITVRDLLTFTFGFGMAVEMFAAAEPWPVVEAVTALRLASLGPTSPTALPDPDEWIAAFGSLPLMCQPGERWLYNTGAQVLGVLAARAADASFPEVLRTRIFDPLGMTGTSFWTPETDRVATAYAAPDGALQVTDPPDGEWSRPPKFPDGAAGLLSTADDLLSFSRMFLRGGEPVLSPASVAEMTRGQVSAAQRGGADAFLGGWSWGLCQAVTVSGHHVGAFGWNGGFGTSWLVDPSARLAVVVLTQRQFETAQPPAVHREIQAAAYGALTP
jgi:CubicO group peptidase (beta-lactamase class C family)